MPITVQEADYDRNIRPLVDAIKDRCEKAGIPFIASFDLSGGAAKTKDFFVTTSTSRSRLPEKFNHAVSIILANTGFKRSR